MPAWLAAALGIPLVLVAAKFHGRQLRLEREQEGYHEVHFGGNNPPYVEALWRRDRVRFWIATPILAALGLAFALLDIGLALVAALLWAPALAFTALGLISGARARWPHVRGTAGWGALVGVLGVAGAMVAR